MPRKGAAIAVLVLVPGCVRMAAAEVGEVRLATAHCIGYLPLIVMEHHKLFEKHAKAAELGNVEYIIFISSRCTRLGDFRCMMVRSSRLVRTEAACRLWHLIPRINIYGRKILES